MRGRKPHPTAVKILRNNPGRRPLNEHEPKHPELDPTVPPELTSDAARQEWERIVPTLAKGHVTTVDRAILIGYCQKYALWQALEKDFAAHAKSVVKAPSGYLMPNPLIAMANRAFLTVLKVSAELGITPSSRSRIVVDPYLDHEDVDEFTAYQRKRRGL